jgi:hypothetical protein
MLHKNYSHTHGRNTGGVCGKLLSAEGHFITPAVLPGCRRSHKGTQWEWLLYTGVCAILISAKFPNTVSQLLQEALSMKQQWCGKTQISNYPQMVQHLDQYLMKPGQLDEIC